MLRRATHHTPMLALAPGTTEGCSNLIGSLLVSPKLSGAGRPNRASCAAIASLESDRPDRPRAGDAYGDISHPRLGRGERSASRGEQPRGAGDRVARSSRIARAMLATKGDCTVTDRAVRPASDPHVWLRTSRGSHRHRLLALAARRGQRQNTQIGSSAIAEQIIEAARRAELDRGRRATAGGARRC